MDEGVGGQDFVTATLREMGICLAPMRSILIQKGYFVGHKYHFDGGYAIRLLEENAIEIYDDDGKLLKTVSREKTDRGNSEEQPRKLHELPAKRFPRRPAHLGDSVLRQFAQRCFLQ
jgi:hypothetical protein